MVDYVNGQNRQIELNNEAKERYELVSERLRELLMSDNLDLANEALEDFFSEEIGFLCKICDVLDGKSVNPNELWGNTIPENYEESFLNPAFAVKCLGEELGQLVTVLASDLLSTIPYAFKGQIYQANLFLEFFLQVFCEIQAEMDLEEVKEDIFYFYHDNSEIFSEDSIYETVDTSLDFYKKILLEEDLSNPEYLYKYGAFIGDNELKMSRFLANTSPEKIDAMADTLVTGFLKGFVQMRKDITKKKTVKLEFPMGMEIVAKRVMEKFKEHGLETVVHGDATLSLFGIGGRKRGVYTNSLNPQYEFDHKNDKAYYFDKRIAKRMLEVREQTFESLKDKALDFAGPALTETFGTEDFNPVNKPESLSLSKEQRDVRTWYANESLALMNRYMSQEERSFSIISYPLPSIGEDFEKIFEMTMRVNTLPYELYQNMQQKIIDVLDEGEKVHVKGCGDNETDIIVSLHSISEKETNFENCVADVNIPVGEVFTSPVLKGTDGVLNVSGVYLEGLYFKNLKITFKDGMITDYTCDNFEKEEDNRKLIQENILFFHDTLPIGEFAIGTNTIAYVEAKKYDIIGKLPILIAEKCGPHFAVGDTCYSYEEDSHFYNPDGKEIIAKENEVSSQRKTDASKAYFSCHTDITIPYEELEFIRAIKQDGSEVSIIENGRFVVLGTEELNKPFEV